MTDRQTDKVCMRTDHQIGARSHSPQLFLFVVLLLTSVCNIMYICRATTDGRADNSFAGLMGDNERGQSEVVENGGDHEQTGYS